MPCPVPRGERGQRHPSTWNATLGATGPISPAQSLVLAGLDEEIFPRPVPGRDPGGVRAGATALSSRLGVARDLRGGGAVLEGVGHLGLGTRPPLRSQSALLHLSKPRRVPACAGAGLALPRPQPDGPNSLRARFSHPVRARQDAVHHRGAIDHRDHRSCDRRADLFPGRAGGRPRSCDSGRSWWR